MCVLFVRLCYFFGCSSGSVLCLSTYWEAVHSTAFCALHLLLDLCVREDNSGDTQ